MYMKLTCGLGQYAMPAVQSDAKKVTAHRFGNGAKETSSRFLHYSPRLNFGTFVPTTVLTAVGAHSCSAAIAANIAWRNASSALTASERACIAATAAWSFGSSSRGRKSRYPAVMVTPLASAFRKRRLRPPRLASRHLRPTGTVMIDICLGGRTRQYPRIGGCQVSNLQPSSASSAGSDDPGSASNLTILRSAQAGDVPQPRHGHQVFADGVTGVPAAGEFALSPRSARRFWGFDARETLTNRFPDLLRPADRST